MDACPSSSPISVLADFVRQTYGMRGRIFVRFLKMGSLRTHRAHDAVV